MEIERKFLVKTLPENLSSYPWREIVQAYISTDPVIRLRKSGPDFFLTVKGAGLLSRSEHELALSEEQYARLLAKAEGRPIEKRRYLIPLADGLTAELDVFGGFLAGLLTVEVEFGDEDNARNFTPPQWFGDEVTYDKKYQNSSLYVLGLP